MGGMDGHPTSLWQTGKWTRERVIGGEELLERTCGPEPVRLWRTQRLEKGWIFHGKDPVPPGPVRTVMIYPDSGRNVIDVIMLTIYVTYVKYKRVF